MPTPTDGRSLVSWLTRQM